MAQSAHPRKSVPGLRIDPLLLQHIIGQARVWETLPACTGGPKPPASGDVRYPFPRQVSDPSRDELSKFILRLGTDEQADLLALAWLGRGTYEAGEWDEALSEARAACSERTPDYLARLPMLADCLEEGLAAYVTRNESTERDF